MKVFLMILSAGILLLQLSCASLSKEECQMGNWYDYGHRDANKGESSDVFIKHAEACSKYGVNGNKEQYMAGFNEGLKAFCSPENGYEYGLKGQVYRNTCPPQQHVAFNVSYRKGKEIYDIKTQISSLERDIDSLSTSMVDPSLSTSQRTKAAFDLREKERRKSDLQKRLLVLEIREELKNK